MDGLGGNWYHPAVKIARVKADAGDRRFHAYCIGLPKTGTTSIGTIFGNYRSDKWESPEQKDAFCDFIEGKLTKSQVLKFVLQRDRRGRLEMDATSGNWMYLDILKQQFPAAKFILTVRDCYSWCDSLINVLIARAVGEELPAIARLFRCWGKYEIADLFRDEKTAIKRIGDILDCILPMWIQSDSVARRAPASRTLVVRTSDISSSLKTMADFVGVKPATLLKDRDHSRETWRKFHIFQKVDRGLLEKKFSAYADSALMRKYFPEARLTDFLRKDEKARALMPATRRKGSIGPADLIFRAESSANDGRQDLAERLLARAEGLNPGPRELRRIATQYLRLKEHGRALEILERPGAGKPKDLGF